MNTEQLNAKHDEAMNLAALADLDECVRILKKPERNIVGHLS